MDQYKYTPEEAINKLTIEAIEDSQKILAEWKESNKKIFSDWDESNKRWNKVATQCSVSYFIFGFFFGAITVLFLIWI